MPGDYSSGTHCRFQTKFLAQLENQIDRQQFEESVKCLLLLMLGFAFLREAAARKTPKTMAPVLQKPGNCPPLEDNSVKVDIRILNQNQGIAISHDFQNRSISPWDYNITRDPHRFPSEIAEAQCRHLGCINAQGQEDNSMNSVAIQQEILVLRREPQDCSHSFRLEKVRVTVGCTCVTPIVHHVA
ncbi:interleukin-17F [Marmota marmota marmota]|uniref:interleukin-17F n=1 Tax=Marmota marmota marmota TaxID=9994 RepID=UPI0007628FDE|nr:interleukin-17F [Marmota marmota marmota]